jgi:spermidine synthase
MKKHIELPEVNISEWDGVRYLHLGTEWVQGSMRVGAPFEIDLDYVQRMMAWLLFVEPSSVHKRHAMQLGLGSGSLTKFCHKRLRMMTSVLEINPQVVNVCKQWFKLPPEDERLKIHLGDAQELLASGQFDGAVDAAQVDLYDHEAAAPVLDSVEFYKQVRATLTDDGAMTVNLFGRDASFDKSLTKIRKVFGTEAVWSFRPTKEGNTVVLALKESQSPERESLRLRAEVIESRWKLPAKKWLRLLKPVD